MLTCFLNEWKGKQESERLSIRYHMYFQNPKFYGFLCEGLLENRIFIYKKDPLINATHKSKAINTALIGASICYYSGVLGSIFSSSCLDAATPTTIKNKVILVNINSLACHILRRLACSTDKEMHALYLEHKKGLYHYNQEQIDRVKECIKAHSENFLVDFCSLYNICLSEAKAERGCLKAKQAARESSSLLAYPPICVRKEKMSSLQKMLKNTSKAFKEHGQSLDRFNFKIPAETDVFSNASMIEKICNLKAPLTIYEEVVGFQGARPTMEDAYFFSKIEGGILAGVLDGHGGGEVAQYAAGKISQEFEKQMSLRDDPYFAFNETIRVIQEQIISNSKWDSQGSTALICFIDLKFKLIYTATVGDSEAKIYRKSSDSQMMMIPLSCVRNWSSKSDAKRASIALGQPAIADKWQKLDAKDIYFPLYLERMGVNVSRALGDKMVSQWKGKEGVIHKPKITVNLLEEGDRIILASDGLWDYVSDNKLAAFMKYTLSGERVANDLVNLAVQRGSRDNITVLALELTKKRRKEMPVAGLEEIR